MRWMRMCRRSLALSVLAVVAGTVTASAQVPAAIAAPGETAVLTVHAQGAQVYECKAGSDGKLAVTAHRGKGALSGVSTVQRIDTAGGVLTGTCDKAGAFHSAPYAADYVF